MTDLAAANSHRSGEGTLEGRRLIVTGAASGIGKAIAQVVAGAGAHVMLVDRDEVKLIEAAGSITGRGATVAHHVTDVREEPAIDRMVGAAVAELDGVDGLVTSAGITIPEQALEVRMEDFDAVLQVNLRGTFLCARAVARHMTAANAPGSMVTIASTLAFTGVPLQTPYVASKAGVVAMTKNLAIEWGRHGIRVNCVAPGIIDTPLASLASEVLDEYTLRTPLGRVGQVEDIATVVRFLLSDDARYVTGQTLAVNGGHSMPS
jgi:NAD(P)-dependent dehydrogenase (short-subunit alcohol dehydrogenase family)